MVRPLMAIFCCLTNVFKGGLFNKFVSMYARNVHRDILLLIRMHHWKMLTV